MITKQSIDSVIAKGTAKQRSLLIVNNFAQTLMNQKGFLSDNEVQVLLNSLQKPSAIKKYNRLKRSEEIIRNFLSYLQQLRLVAQGSFVHAAGWALLMLNLRNTEWAVNTALDNVTDEGRQTVTDEIVSGLRARLYFADVSFVDGHGLSFVTNGSGGGENSDFKLETLMRSAVDKFISDWSLLKTSLQIVSDYMTETESDIRVYKDKISEVALWNENIVARSLLLFSNGNSDINSAILSVFDSYAPLPVFDDVEINSSFYSYLKEYMFLW